MTPNADPFAGALDPPLTRAETTSYIQERVGSLLRKGSPNEAAIRKLRLQIASHDGPPTKEEVDEHIRLKYGPIDRAIDGYGNLSKRAPFESHFSSASTPGDGASHSSDSIGF